jgi:hypothetical protein
LSTHFLFIRIEPMAEGGRWAEVYFSDQAEAGDPKFVDNIASTQLQPLGAWRELRPAFPSLPWQRLIPPGQRRTGLVCGRSVQGVPCMGSKPGRYQVVVAQR